MARRQVGVTNLHATPPVLSDHRLDVLDADLSTHDSTTMGDMSAMNRASHEATARDANGTGADAMGNCEDHAGKRSDSRSEGAIGEKTSTGSSF